MAKSRSPFVLVFAGLLLGVLSVPCFSQVQTLTCPAPGFGEVVLPAGAPPLLLSSLKAVPNPVIPIDPATNKPAIRADLADYVVNLPAAIQLGKALFWDMQAGSDNKTACATCHFHGGADRRLRNQLAPGPDGQWEGYGANLNLTSGDFPLVASHDNIVGSQGVRKSTYQGLSKSGAELTVAAADPVFSVGGKNVRQVTGLQSPTVVNAVFNHRNFWNGRAQNEFNGINVWGSRDSSARVWVLASNNTVSQIDIRIPNAALASQAVGPPLSSVEMSAAGRTFPELGVKMLPMKPLALQKVSTTDSVLGSLAGKSGTGLNTTYQSLIQTAFQKKWWGYSKTVSVNGKSYSQMQANYSLFWGIALMLYQATLVADNSPMDQYLATRVFDPTTHLMVSHNPSLLDPVISRLASEGITATPEGAAITREKILSGLSLFEQPVAPMPFVYPPPAGTGVGCSLCHVGAETTSASVRALTAGGVEAGDQAFKNSGFDIRMERMFMQLPPVPLGTTEITYDQSNYTVMSAVGQARVATYDAGWYNVGVRPTADDHGLGDKDPFGKYLSWTQFFQASSNPSTIRVPGGGLGCATTPPAAAPTSPFAGEVLNPLTGFPLLSGGLTKDEGTDVDGSFKTPGLRNVELFGPYFHNGHSGTLRQAVEFYDEGGAFANETRSPLIRPLGMTSDQITDLVAFMLSLTDERVRLQKAPFDHPQLFVPDGDLTPGTDNLIEVPAVGSSGSTTPLGRFLGMNPFQQ